MNTTHHITWAGRRVSKIKYYVKVLKKGKAGWSKEKCGELKKKDEII